MTSSLGKADDNEAINKVRYLFVAALAAATTLEIVTASVSGLAAKDAMRFVALNLIVGGAAGFGGGLLGFIFGVPKSLTDGDHPPGGAQTGASQTNTNLEQISDWLTKILVGAGLTSLTSLPGFGAKVIEYLNHNGYEGLPGGGTLAVFLMVYFGTAGFFWSYIETRTTLTDLFNERAARVPTDVIQQVRLAPAEPGRPPIQEDAEILRLAPSSLTTVELLDARASAEIRANQLGKAIETLQRAMQMAPTNVQIRHKLAFALSSAGRTAEADKLITEAKTDAEKAGNTAELNQLAVNELFNALYKPNGYDQAIEIGSALLKTDLASNGNLHLWLACAYGQRAAALKQRSADYSAEKAAALERLRAMKEVRPDLLPQARAVWQPDRYQGNKDENDLEVFRDDPDFAEILL